MWYLVIPPIIVVLSLSFLLWYLSRKGTDPLIAEKISQSEEEKPSFSRTKEFFLRLLEKWAQRFKVASLRTHNSLHEFSQSVKERRRKIKENDVLETAQPVPVSFSKEVPVSEKKESFFSRLKKGIKREEKAAEEIPLTIESERSESRLEDPIIRRRRQEDEVVSIQNEKEDVPRPMVSETAAEPEIRKKRLKPNVSREESLIAQIAVNPKDFTAYEALGDYYLEIENIKDAKECYRQVLKLSPVHRMVKIKIRRLEKLLTREGE